METAIKACRQAGYFDHALYLAKRYGEHDAYLKILLEDVHKYEDALQYLSSLPSSEVCEKKFIFPFIEFEWVRLKNT